MKRLLQSFVDAKSGVMAIVQTGAANVAVQAANIVCGVLTARTFGPAGRGTLAAIIMWPQFLAYALSFGVPVASLYWMKRDPQNRQDLAGAALLLSCLAGVIAAVAGILIIPHSLHIYSADTIHFAQLLVLLCPVALSTVTLTTQLQTADAFGVYNLFRFLSPLSVLAVLCVEKITHTLTVTTAALAYLLAVLPATVWIVFWIWRHARPSLRRIKLMSTMLLGYGVRAWGADLLSTVANQVDRILVVGLLSPTAMGLYIVAQSAAGLLAILPQAVVPVTLPKSSGLSNPEILEITGKAIRLAFLVMVLAALPLLFAGGLLLKLVYGTKFASAYVVLPFLVIESVLDGLTSILAQAFLAAGFPGTLTLLEVCGLLTTLPLLYWLIPKFGLEGAGCALMLGTTVRFTFVMLNFPFRMKLRPPNLFIRRLELLALFRS